MPGRKRKKSETSHSKTQKKAIKESPPPPVNDQNQQPTAETSNVVPVTSSIVFNPYIPLPQTMGPPADYRFGWEQIDSFYIPYIYRYNERYCAVAIAESVLITKYLRRFNRKLDNCVDIVSYPMTIEESKLYNEINFVHSNGMYSNVPFTTSSLIIKYDDMIAFYYFLKFCYHKLTNTLNKNEWTTLCTVKENISESGFIHIVNEGSLVPYVVHESRKLLPLFYFEGDINPLQEYAERITKWEHIYIKFCFIVQEIRPEFYMNEFDLVDLQLVKTLYPNYVQFEEYWPKWDKCSTFLTAGPHDESWVKWHSTLEERRVSKAVVALEQNPVKKVVRMVVPYPQYGNVAMVMPKPSNSRATGPLSQFFIQN